MPIETISPQNGDFVESVLPSASETESLQDALYGDDNALVAMRYPVLLDKYRRHVECNKTDIEQVIQNLLGVRWCRIMTSQLWKSGSFNLAIPVYLPDERTVYLRLPLSYRLGEMQCPGNAEEKLRTEIATYQWISKNCSDVPIPTIHAFGLPDGSTYTYPHSAPFLERAWSFFQGIKRRLFGQPATIPHIRRPFRHPLDHGFLLISKARGKSLAVSWEKHCQEKTYRENLFRGLARISVSLNSVAFNRIGALSLQPDLSIALTNRPLHLYFHMLENEGIPIGIPRDRTYAETEAYISDLLTVQDNKLRHQPNAIHDETDGRKQLAALTAMRATIHHFTEPELRAGPFHYTLTDLHPSNIFVDEHWNVQDIIDLEWSHSMPLQMQRPPFWLTSRGLDGFDNDAAVSEYAAVLDEYFEAYETEERRRNGTDTQTSVQRDMWQRGSFWYFYAAAIPTVMYSLFNKRIQPLFNKDHTKSTAVDDVLHYYWGRDLGTFTERKLAENKEYQVNVREQYYNVCGSEDSG